MKIPPYLDFPAAGTARDRSKIREGAGEFKRTAINAVLGSSAPPKSRSGIFNVGLNGALNQPETPKPHQHPQKFPGFEGPQKGAGQRCLSGMWGRPGAPQKSWVTSNCWRWPRLRPDSPGPPKTGRHPHSGTATPRTRTGSEFRLGKPREPPAEAEHGGLGGLTGDPDPSRGTGGLRYTRDSRTSTGTARAKPGSTGEPQSPPRVPPAHGDTPGAPRPRVTSPPKSPQQFPHPGSPGNSRPRFARSEHLRCPGERQNHGGG